MTEIKESKILLLKIIALFILLFSFIGGLIAWGAISTHNFRNDCNEKGGVVFRSNYDQICIKKDQVIEDIKIK